MTSLELEQFSTKVVKPPHSQQVTRLIDGVGVIDEVILGVGVGLLVTVMVGVGVGVGVQQLQLETSPTKLQIGGALH